MAITDKEQGVWDLDEVYNKQNQGGIWTYNGIDQLWGWGANDYGALGFNEGPAGPTNRKWKSSPTQMPGTTWQTEYYGSPDTKWASVLAKTDGKLWAWGEAFTGETGLNDRVDRSSPTQIGTGSDWRVGGTGREYSFAIKTDGRLYLWGQNGYGQLGQNTINDNRSSPAQVPGGNWSNLWCGHDSLFAIKTDGTLWAWGRNGGGELGLNEGPGNEKSSPCQIGTATNWVRGAPGAEYGAHGAINSDGELWVWGYNQNGELGQDSHQTPAYRGISAPVQIPGTNWEYFQGCGSSGSIAKKTDGTLWVWGGGTISSAATGDTTQRSSPCQVGTATNWNRISGGTGNGLATKTDGTLWIWGSNGSGRLGQNDASMGTRSSPIQIPGGIWNNMFMTGENSIVYASKTF